MEIKASPGAEPGTTTVHVYDELSGETIFATHRVALAERRLYDAEGALHAAHQTGVDAWICAAADRLHDAVVEHVNAVNALHAA